ncbi:MAG: hypothetical protein ACRBBZ_07360 [Nitrosopumilus sp.]
MAEASVAAFTAAICVAVSLAVVCFVLRGKGHHDDVPVTIRE